VKTKSVNMQSTNNSGAKMATDGVSDNSSDNSGMINTANVMSAATTKDVHSVNHEWRQMMGSYSENKVRTSTGYEGSTVNQQNSFIRPAKYQKTELKMPDLMDNSDNSDLDLEEADFTRLGKRQRGPMQYKQAAKALNLLIDEKDREKAVKPLLLLKDYTTRSNTISDGYPVHYKTVLNTTQVLLNTASLKMDKNVVATLSLQDGETDTGEHCVDLMVTYKAMTMDPPDKNTQYNKVRPIMGSVPRNSIRVAASQSLEEINGEDQVSGPGYSHYRAANTSTSGDKRTVNHLFKRPEHENRFVTSSSAHHCGGTLAAHHFKTVECTTASPTAITVL
jgi:hypothetical protein